MGKGERLIGQTLSGKYELLSLIGEGGMGAVFRAKQTYMDREVAIKVLSISEDSGVMAEEYLARFKREAQTASQIKHPSAITIYDFGVETIDGQETPYLAMELIQGRTLKSIIDDGPMDPKRSVEIITQVCGALEEAHELGIVHRDLKPDNIMVSTRSNGTEWPHVLDFGIAKIISEQGDSGMTRTGVLLGTPRYMSPEQVRGLDIKRHSDIYSVGIILYEMLSGESVFEATSFMAVALKQVNEMPQALRERIPELKIPAKLEEAVMKSLNKDPDERQQSARELAEELVAAVNTSISDMSLSFAPDGNPDLPSKNKNLKAIGIGLVGLVLLLAAWFFSSGGEGEKKPPSDKKVVAPVVSTTDETAEREAQQKRRRKAEEKTLQQAAELEQQRKTARQKAAEEAKQRKAELARKKAAEAAQRKREAEEALQRAAKEEALQKAAEQERQRKLEEELQRKAEEELQRKAEEERQRQAELERQRKAAEEALRKAEEADQQRKAAEEDALRRAAELEKQRKAVAEELQRAAESYVPKAKTTKAAQELEKPNLPSVETKKSPATQTEAGGSRIPVDKSTLQPSGRTLPKAVQPTVVVTPQPVEKKPAVKKPVKKKAVKKKQVKRKRTPRVVKPTPTPIPTPEVRKKKRRRCGPAWCP